MSLSFFFSESKKQQLGRTVSFLLGPDSDMKSTGLAGIIIASIAGRLSSGHFPTFRFFSFLFLRYGQIRGIGGFEYPCHLVAWAYRSYTPLPRVKQLISDRHLSGTKPFTVSSRVGNPRTGKRDEKVPCIGSRAFSGSKARELETNLEKVKRENTSESPQVPEKERKRINN
jgi:hypothetical protein